ncbi:hypothetical protein C8Q76DRAFT_792879 [Earliella scabrosa]|nr:hypothetical protein C8Q76DRAFT_792879 [Earliella scabrosa]
MRLMKAADEDSKRTLAQARNALERLVSLVCLRSGCSVDGQPSLIGKSTNLSDTCEPLRRSEDTESSTSRVKLLHILMYFDEAHVLTNPLLEQTRPTGKRATPTTSKSTLAENSSSSEGKTALGVLFSALDDCRDLGLFTLFLSTQPTLQDFATPSTRHRKSAGSMHAPITETPFDCFGPRQLDPSKLCARDVGDVTLMACFGRPMWQSLLLPCRAVDKFAVTVDGSAAVAHPSRAAAQSVALSDRCDALVALARSKLLCAHAMEKALGDYTHAAKTAVLDVRVMLPFNLGRDSARDLVEELVAGHMRDPWHYV